jgi:hypothetical protein
MSSSVGDEWAARLRARSASSKLLNRSPLFIKNSLKQL